MLEARQPAGLLHFGAGTRMPVADGCFIRRAATGYLHSMRIDDCRAARRRPGPKGRSVPMARASYPSPYAHSRDTRLKYRSVYCWMLEVI
jgi:hypothetical protein